MNRFLKKTAVFFLTVLIITLCVSISALADMGPKDAVKVTVTNPPDEPYYLDLLTNEVSGSGDDNLREKRDQLDQTMLALLYSKTDEGWWPAYAAGTGAPIFGSLTGSKSGDAMVHEFSYFGVPETYRIIIVTESGKISISDVRTRQNLQSSVIYDFSTGELTDAPVVRALVFQFIETLIATLVIEGLLLLLFGFKLRDNYLVFLLTNLATQILLALLLGIAQIKYGIMAAIFALVFIEFIILVAESIIYGLFLKGKPVGRRVAYSIVANLASLFTGIALMALVGN